MASKSPPRKQQPRKKVLPPRFTLTSSTTHQPALNTITQTPSTTNTEPPSTTTTEPPSTTTTQQPSTATDIIEQPSNTVIAPSTTTTQPTSKTTDITEPPSNTVTAPSTTTTITQPPSTTTTITQTPPNTITDPSTTITEPPLTGTSITEPPSHTVTAPLTEWGDCSWAIKASPVEAIIPSDIGYVFCYMHDSLLNVVPRDDIYAQLPCQLLLNRRCNLPQDGTNAVHSKRYFNPNKTTTRTIDNTTATWSNKKKWKSVAGKNGEIAGLVYPLMLTFKGKPGIWEADEYVSFNCKDGKSAIVVLRCLNATWREVEQNIYKAEKNLAFAYRKRVAAIDAESQKDISSWNDSVEEYKRQLASAISALENERGNLLTEEGRMGEVIGSVSHGGRMTGGIRIREPADYQARRATGGIRIEEPLDNQARRVTGGIRIEEPSDVLRTNTLGSIGYVTDEVDDGEHVEEMTGGGTSYYDRVTARRAADRAREKAKGKQKVTEK